MGYLSKRGGRIHTWHKRWFVLTGDLLFYYKTPQVSEQATTFSACVFSISHSPFALCVRKGRQGGVWFGCGVQGGGSLLIVNSCKHSQEG